VNDEKKKVEFPKVFFKIELIAKKRENEQRRIGDDEIAIAPVKAKFNKRGVIIQEHADQEKCQETIQPCYGAGQFLLVEYVDAQRGQQGQQRTKIDIVGDRPKE